MKNFTKAILIGISITLLGTTTVFGAVKNIDKHENCDYYCSHRTENPSCTFHAENCPSVSGYKKQGISSLVTGNGHHGSQSGYTCSNHHSCY